MKSRTRIAGLRSKTGKARTHVDRLRAANADLKKKLTESLEQETATSEHPTTATSINNLATVLNDQGNFTEARPLYERALAIREKALGPEHPDTAASFSNLATLLYHQGDFARARPLLERVVAIRREYDPQREL